MVNTASAPHVTDQQGEGVLPAEHMQLDQLYRCNSLVFHFAGSSIYNSFIYGRTTGRHGTDCPLLLFYLHVPTSGSNQLETSQTTSTSISLILPLKTYQLYTSPTYSNLGMYLVYSTFSTFSTED